MVAVSVIVPCYNHAKYVACTLDALLAQTFQDIELIIVDDGSTDESANVILSYEKKCRERFVDFTIIQKKKNYGVVDSLKTLIASARGKYIYSTASDDMPRTEAVEVFYTYLENNPTYSLVCANDDMIDANNTRIYWGPARETIYDRSKATYETFADFLHQWRSDIDFESEDFGSYKSFLKSNYIPNGFMWRADAIKAIVTNMVDGYIEDWYLMLQFSKNHRIKYLDRVLYAYRWHDKNLVRNKLKITKRIFRMLWAERAYCHQKGLVKDFYFNLVYYSLYFPGAVISACGGDRLVSYVKRNAKKILQNL